jgi:hypothetical protein
MSALDASTEAGTDKRDSTGRKTHEEGYKPVLLRDETKEALLKFRMGLPGRDLFRERRMVTAAVEMALEHPELHDELKRRTVGVCEREAKF